MNRRVGVGIALLGTAMGAAGAVYFFTPREWSTMAPAMGTHATVTLVGTPYDKMDGKIGRLSTAVLDEISAVERLMSVYRPGSDIGRLNRSAAGEELPIDVRTFEALNASVESSRLTGGAFNIFILPAELLWGFKTGRARRVPPPGKIEIPDGGGSGISLRAADGRHFAKLLKDGMKIDLGGIAAGYAVDRAVSVLRKMGASGALVDIGGDCYCLGTSARGTPWRIGVRHPRGDGLLTVLELSNKAVATSGDYEDFFVEGGRQYSHIFDPRTRRPAESGVISATVISNSCTAADALSTAMVVMGKEEGLRLIRALPSADCILVTEKAGCLSVVRSSDKAGD
jgi:thiamine biosynthesis lipoprotein